MRVDHRAARRQANVEMNHRIALGVGAVTFALLITGLALGGDTTIGRFDSHSGSSVTSSVEPTTFPTSALSVTPGGISIPDGSSMAFEIGHAGTVIVGRIDDVLKIVSVQPTEGWISEIRDTFGRVVGGMLRNPYIGVTYTFALNDGVTRFSIESIAQDSIAAATSLATADGEDAASPTNETSPRPATTAITMSSTTSTTAQSATTTVESGVAPESPATTTTSLITTTTLPPITTTTNAPPTNTTTSVPPTTITTVPPTTTTTVPAVTTTTDPEGEWVPIVLVSDGGSIVVSYRPGEVRLDAVIPAVGFEVGDVDEEKRSVRVQFESTDASYTIVAKWDKGELITDITSSG